MCELARVVLMILYPFIAHGLVSGPGVWVA